MFSEFRCLKNEIEAKSEKSTDVIIPPNHLSLPGFSLNMAKSQGANMPICSILHFQRVIVSSFTHPASISVYISPPWPSSNTSSLPPTDHSFLLNKISILLLSLPCLPKNYSKMAGRRLSSLAEVLLEWSVLSCSEVFCVTN